MAYRRYTDSVLWPVSFIATEREIPTGHDRVQSFHSHAQVPRVRDVVSPVSRRDLSLRSNWNSTQP
jgi:hypothetical protein